MTFVIIVVGSTLFLAEWLLGSMGWGILHGTLLFVGVAMASVLAGLGVSGTRLAREFAGGLIIAILLSVLFVYALPNQLFTAMGDASGLAIEPGVRPLVFGLISGAIVGLLLGLLLGSRWKVPLGTAAAVGFGAGLLIGALFSVTYEPHVAVGVAVTFGYVTWIILMIIPVAREGIDVEKLKLRFTPTQTIETSKETLEWLQKRMPPGIG
jgi:hypothetical protein